MKNAFEPCGHEPAQSAAQLHGVCVFCYRDRLGKAEAELKARTVQERDAARFRYLQNIPVLYAQAFFWNHSSRKQRAATIDAAMRKEGK